MKVTLINEAIWRFGKFIGNKRSIVDHYILSTAFRIVDHPCDVRKRWSKQHNTEMGRLPHARQGKTAKKKAFRRPQKIKKTANWPKKLCLWTDEQMTWATEAVKSGDCGLTDQPSSKVSQKQLWRIESREGWSMALSLGQWLILAIKRS